MLHNIETLTSRQRNSTYVGHEQQIVLAHESERRMIDEVFATHRPGGRSTKYGIPGPEGTDESVCDVNSALEILN